jgi:phosphoglycerate dehydrogenase-like enzyme
MIRVALLDDYQRVALKLAPWDQLGPGVKVEAFHDNVQDPAKLAERLAPFQVAMALRERAPFGRALLERLPNLRLIASAGMWNAAIDLAAATELGILVCGSSGSLRTTTELTWGLILACTRGIPQTRERLRRGGWQDFLGWGLEGKTLGLVGLGNIGRQVAEIAKAFRMKVLAWSQNLSAERAAEGGAEYVSKDDLFRRADVVSIHLKLSERTRGLIGGHELGLMKPTAYLVNTSRGPIVEEGALVEALRTGRIAGAGLDVFDQEPLPAGHPLLGLDNVVATPHLGYVTEEVLSIFYRDTLDNIRGWLAGDYRRVMNPDVLTHMRPR